MTQLALAGFGLLVVGIGLVGGIAVCALTTAVTAPFRARDERPPADVELDAQLACPICGDRCCIQAAA